MRIRQFGKWHTSKAKVEAPDDKSNQRVAIHLGKMVIEMSEDEAYSLANDLTDFLEA